MTRLLALALLLFTTTAALAAPYDVVMLQGKLVPDAWPGQRLLAGGE